MNKINPKTNIKQIDLNSFSRNKRLGSIENNLQYPESYIIKTEQNKCADLCVSLGDTIDLDQIFNCIVDELDTSCIITEEIISNTLALVVASSGRAYMTNDENLITWTELTPFGDTTRNYTSICASRASGVFGKYIYIGVADGFGISISDDFGQTWRQAFVGNRVACSADGRYVYAHTQANPVIQYSSDYGQTWTQVNAGANVNRLSCNDTGQYVYLNRGVSSFVFRSSDFGATYELIPGIPGPTSVEPVAASNDGSTFFSSAFSNPPSGLFNKWTNFGATRTQFQLDANPQSYIYTRIDCDPTATTVITCRGTGALLNTGRVYINTTGGNETGWTEVAPTGVAMDIEWRDVATNGNKFMAASTERIYASLDGINWFETQPAGNTNQSWTDIKLY